MSISSSQPQKQVQEDPLALAVNRLREAIATDAPGRERPWAEGVQSALAVVEAAVRKHLAAARSPQGVLAEVDETRPTLARQADELCSEHGDLMAQVNALRNNVQRAAQAFQPTLDASTSGAKGIADFGAIRQEVQQLLASLEQHTEAETRLVQESLLTDIGVGD